MYVTLCCTCVLPTTDWTGLYGWADAMCRTRSDKTGCMWILQLLFKLPRRNGKFQTRTSNNTDYDYAVHQVLFGVLDIKEIISDT